MRSHPAEFEMASPGSLAGALRLMDEQPGEWLPVAGATEVMVLFSAGKLASRRLVNIWDIPDLRAIHEEAESLTLGGGCTFTDLRNTAAVRRHFPLLAQAASWTGSLANQNRATLAGNLANASPAADSSPVMLAYDAELELTSARGTRRLPYRDFHLCYRTTALDARELILSIRLKKHFDGYFSYGRKVGARNAQAISKVCVAALGRLHDGHIADVRIGMGAVAPIPLRLASVEALLQGQRIDNDLIAVARRALDAAIAPIDDIRSVSDYRRFVAGNLLEEFLRKLADSAEIGSPALARWNVQPEDAAAQGILPCCGSLRWALELARLRPMATDAELFAASDRVWLSLDPADWDEAFRSHPRIGERKAAASATQTSAAWSRQEQNGIDAQNAAILAELARGNEEYETRFGRIFLVCATSKTAAEMLATLHRRLGNDAETELREAAEQQRQITELRLRKWLRQ